MLPGTLTYRDQEQQKETENDWNMNEIGRLTKKYGVHVQVYHIILCHVQKSTD